jgi:hypothetical protein
VSYLQICYFFGYTDYLLEETNLAEYRPGQIQLIFTSDKYDLYSTYVLNLYTIHVGSDINVNIN